MENKKLTDKQIAELKAPLPAESVKPHPTKSYLSTIKAIYVIERLNQVFGLGGWLIHNEIVETSEKNIVVKSSFEAPEYGIIIPDIFGGNDNADRGDAYKGACTDALTKIGSYLYIGMDVFKGLTDRKDKPETKADPKLFNEYLKEVKGALNLDHLKETWKAIGESHKRKEITDEQFQTLTEIKDKAKGALNG